MNLNNQVWEIMTSDVTTVSDDTPLYKLKDILRKKMIHHLPVENSKGELVGIISSEDFGRINHFTVPENEILAKHIMTVSPIKIKADTKIKTVVNHFLDNRFRAIPVVDKHKEIIVGIVTPYDIMDVLMKGYIASEKQK